jgi:hypothetical protein
VDTHGAAGYDPADLEPLFCFRYGVADDDVVNSYRVQCGQGGQETFYDVDSQVVGSVKAKFPSFGFADGGAVAGDDICFLHSDWFFCRPGFGCRAGGLVVYATFYDKCKILV